MTMTNEELFKLINGKQGSGISGNGYPYEGTVNTIDEDHMYIGEVLIRKRDVIIRDINSCCIEFTTKHGGTYIVGL